MRSTLIWLALTVLILLGVGLLFVGSASAPKCIKEGVSTLFYVKKQGLAMSLGLFLAVCLAFFDYHKWKQWPLLHWFSFGALCVLLGAVFLNEASHGARRWISLGIFQFQPSETAKFLGIILTAVAIDKIGWKLNLFWKGLFPLLAGISLVGGLILLEPDYGGGLIFLALTMLLLWVGGARIRYVLGLVLVAGSVIALLIMTNPNRVRRLKESFKEDGYGYQVNNSIVAIRNGGWQGRGYYESCQKWEYLPESHTDYIFAIGAEEGGMVFSMGVLGLYLLFFVLGLRIAYYAPDRLGRLIAYGMTFLVSAQAVANVAVVSGWGFSKGLALPFLSYGGTNVMVALMAVGMIFSVGLRIELPRGRIRGKIKKSISFKGGR